MKAITTRSGVAYEGPSIPTNPSPKKVVERETEETTDKEQSNFQGSTAQIPPPVTPIHLCSLFMNKEKLLELAKIPLNENCSAMLLKKLPEKLGDPDKFLFPYFLYLLSTPSRMTLELRTINYLSSKGSTEDVFCSKLVLEDIECKDSYDSNLDDSTFLVTPLSDSNKDGCLAPGDDIEILLHHDPSTPMWRDYDENRCLLQLSKFLCILKKVIMTRKET
ncbi:hypothetical protein Tco_1264919 [Tanacetum coccineum]